MVSTRAPRATAPPAGRRRETAGSWGVAARQALLGQRRLFRALPEATLREVAARFQPRRLARGAFVFVEGEPAETISLVAAGRVKVVRTTEDGREVILRVLGAGELFGGAGGWGETRYPASAVAQEPSVVLQLPAHEFTRLLSTHPDFALAVIRELGTRLREAEARIRDLQTEPVPRRLARALLRLADRASPAGDGATVVVRLTRRDLAELAGTTLSTASRTLSAWSQAGIIAAGRERVEIRDLRALRAIAEEDTP